MQNADRFISIDGMSHEMVITSCLLTAEISVDRVIFIVNDLTLVFSLVAAARDLCSAESGCAIELDGFLILLYLYKFFIVKVKVLATPIGTESVDGILMRF